MTRNKYLAPPQKDCGHGTGVPAYYLMDSPPISCSDFLVKVILQPGLEGKRLEYPLFYFYEGARPADGYVIYHNNPKLHHILNFRGD